LNEGGKMVCSECGHELFNMELICGVLNDTATYKQSYQIRCTEDKGHEGFHMMCGVFVHHKHVWDEKERDIKELLER